MNEQMPDAVEKNVKQAGETLDDPRTEDPEQRPPGPGEGTPVEDAQSDPDEVQPRQEEEPAGDPE